MAAADDSGGGGGGGSSAFWGRSFLSLRRSQVAAMEPGQEQDLHDLDLFQSHVADRLAALLPGPSTPTTQDKKDPHPHPQEPFLSLPFLAKLLDALLSIDDEFRALLLGRNPALLSKPPLDRLLSDLLDRAVKSLDICNAVSLTLQSLRHWHRHALIAAAAALRGPYGGQLIRARRALARLLASTPLDPYPHDSPRAAGGGSGGGRAEKAWSFGGRGEAASPGPSPAPRSPSWSVSRTWSAARQVQAMSAHLAAPRGESGGAGGAAAGGMAMAAYTMSSVMVFAMWALVAAVPCQERGGPAAGPVAAPPRQLQWAATVTIMQERIADEWRRREKKGSHHQSPVLGGLLAELQAVERCARTLMEAVGESPSGGGGGWPEAGEAAAAELAEACQRLEEGLGPFERQVREVFHRVVRSRAEVLRCLDQSNPLCSS